MLNPCIRLSKSIEDTNELTDKHENYMNSTFDENKSNEYPNNNFKANQDFKHNEDKLKGKKKLDIKGIQPRAISSKKGYKLTKIIPKISSNFHSNPKAKLTGKYSTPIHLTFQGEIGKSLTHRINISTKAKIVKIKEVALQSKHK